MKLIKPSFETIEQEPGFEGILKQIEKVGRTCYKSEDKITEGSAKKFVDMLTTNCHGAMLEHGTVYLKVLLNNELVLEDAYGENNSVSAYNRYINNKYSRVNCRNGLEDIFITDTVEPGYAYITTNYRVLVENGWLDDLKYQCEPTEYHDKRITVKFTCDRGVSHEFVRHRVFSFAQESTRYCNYSKNKFGNELTFITPCWLDSETGHYTSFEKKVGPERWDIAQDDEVYYEWIKDNEVYYPTLDEHYFLQNLLNSERDYLKLINLDWKPQQARAVLPNSLKTELVMTGFIEDWKHFFELRCDTAAHPQARELAVSLQDWFKENNLID